ncbi:MAG: sigma-70 family RNA polymerase sigma factor [Acidobacteriia bacterium]|nr:sigma-70 family RNA polymerase sigma factor [Terriglobia bacterium]
MEESGIPGAPSWPELVERIRAGEPSGMEDLYRVFSEGIRFHLCRQLGSQDLDDKIHDIFVIIAQSIQNGELRQPERLMGYVRTVVRRQIAAYVNGVVETRRREAVLDPGMPVSDHHPDPERRAIERQNAEMAMRVLQSIPKRDREVLVRFYLREQSAPEICGEMGLTENQFRLIKSRAKARFGELGRSRISRRLGFLRSK